MAQAASPPSRRCSRKPHPGALTFRPPSLPRLHAQRSTASYPSQSARRLRSRSSRPTIAKTSLLRHAHTRARHHACPLCRPRRGYRSNNGQNAQLHRIRKTIAGVDQRASAEIGGGRVCPFAADRACRSIRSPCLDGRTRLQRDRGMCGQAPGAAREGCRQWMAR